MVSEDRNIAAQPPRRPGGRSARIRQAVFSATIELLPQHGIGNLSIRQIADRAQVAESTIYRRWKTPSGLAAAAVADYAFTENPVPDTGNLESDLRLFLQNVVSILGKSDMRRLLRIAISLDESDVQNSAAYAEFWRSRFATGSVIVHRAVERGELAPNADPLMVIETLVGASYVRVLLQELPVDNDLMEVSVRAALHIARTVAG
ncbi:transcriptional regulator, TetR family [Arthrobacter sp. cf158]|uniref:TetR/AcrR family transcriptional regulator n=1 Tax=Arthrobacter sp. cf158 TaxID=1761744 RepID=UPI000898A458|nr:TetR/AcrR family transcriptional regulator [Arthrobacter sp. cf158]SDW98255.1 transcriptional regulator, TetR family [Arthrobacter sp. cf158]